MNYLECCSKSYSLEDLTPHENYNFLLCIRVLTTVFTEEDHYYFFRILDEATIEFFMANHYERAKQRFSSIVQEKLSGPLRKQTMTNYLKGLLESSWNIFGTEYTFIESPLIAEEEFYQILDDIATDLALNEYIGAKKWKHSPIIKLCRDNGLTMEPTTYSDHTMFCSCPTGYNHRLIIEADTGAWSCLACKKKGHLEGLGEFIAECKIEFNS